jgi:hypothetical protein
MKVEHWILASIALFAFGHPNAGWVCAGVAVVAATVELVFDER